jgi:6-oxocyclohex-1-ene-1-carbonyl-CoA hydrolase
MNVHQPLKDHDLAPDDLRAQVTEGVIFEKRPAMTPDGKPVDGLYNAWIMLDNPKQFNSYTTEMVKGVIFAFRAASNARDVNAVVFTGTGTQAFCTGGNTKEYAEYYAGHPQEYRQYMRLFNDMVSAILACDKPVICRVNGMRIGGGQEIGMACDFTIAQDLARFGQAGPKHGSAPIGGATDFLPVLIGAERAMGACVLCEPISAHQAYWMGMISDIVPALKVDGQFVANPLVVTDRVLDDMAGSPSAAQDRRGPGRGQATVGQGHGRSVAARRQGRADVRQAAAHLPRLHHQDAGGTAQAQARCLEPQQGERPRLACAQHDDGSARRIQGLQRGHQGAWPGDRLRGPAPGAG